MSPSWGARPCETNGRDTASEGLGKTLSLRIGKQRRMIRALLIAAALTQAAACVLAEVTPRVDRPASAGEARVWPMYLSASGGNEIRNCQSWRNGWEEFVENRALPAARRYGAMWIHNPGGVVSGQPMKFQQFTECEQQAALSGNEELANVADWQSFTAQMSRLASVGPLLIYIGCPETLNLKPGETDRQWLARAREELTPILEIDPKPLIGFDATYGHPAIGETWDRYGGADGLIARLLIGLSDDGYEIVVEPAILAEATWLRDIAGTCATEFWWRRMLHGGQDIRVPHHKPGWGEHLSPTEVRGRQVRMYTELFRKPLPEQRDVLRGTLEAGYDAAIFTGDLMKIDAATNDRREPD